MSNWNYRSTSAQNLNEELILEEIIEGTRPALVIRNFYNKNECQKIIQKITSYSIYNHGKRYLKKIGVFLSAYLNQKEQYFVEAQKSNNQLTKIFNESPAPRINEIIYKTSRIKKILPAMEDGKDYANGIIRIWENEDSGPLHRDYANFESPNFQISRHENQLSCVLYLDSPKSGGELVIHKQKWVKSDEKFRDIEFGYRREVLKSSESVRIVPKQGDLIIFNPRFFHEILPTIGKSKRLTYGYFVGFSKTSDNAEFWS